MAPGSRGLDRDELGRGGGQGEAPLPPLPRAPRVAPDEQSEEHVRVRGDDAGRGTAGPPAPQVRQVWRARPEGYGPRLVVEGRALPTERLELHAPCRPRADGT